MDGLNVRLMSPQMEVVWMKSHLSVGATLRVVRRGHSHGRFLPAYSQATKKAGGNFGTNFLLPISFCKRNGHMSLGSAIAFWFMSWTPSFKGATGTVFVEAQK